MAIYMVSKKQETNELNQTFSKTSITVHDKQEFRRPSSFYEAPQVNFLCQFQIFIRDSERFNNSSFKLRIIHDFGSD